MREKILSALRNSEDYVSGEELSRVLGITRSAVWKNVKQLKKDGYIIQSVRNRGYKLESNPNLLDGGRISDGLQTEIIGKRIIILKSVDSTNEEIKRLAGRLEPSGTVVASEEQSAGKGRFGRVWESEKGGLYFSFLIRPNLPPSDISSVTLAAGYAVCLAIREYTGLDARIKWPNDIIIGKKKVCGILTEMAAQSDCIEYVVIGIGINVNLKTFPKEIEHKATSLLTETGKQLDKSDFFKNVLKHLDAVLSSFLISVSVEDMESFKELCATIGRDVSVERNGLTLTGKAVGISPSGELLIQTSEKILSVSSGEVTVQGIY